MASTFPKTNAHEDASGHRQPGETSAWEAARPGSQGTNAVHGTWCSEGETGRHLRTKAGQRQGTPSPTPVPLRLERIATQAQQYPDMACTTLAHHLDVAMLERAFGSLNPHSAPGVDRVTWQTYKANLETHLAALHEKLVNGTYCPQPVVRRLIPKSNGKLRPLGLPMGHAYCISLQRHLGIAVVAPTSMNVIAQLTQYNELGVADQVVQEKNRSESVRITSNRSGLLTSTPTACFRVNDGLVGQTLMAVQSCHARRRYSWPFTS